MICTKWGQIITEYFKDNFDDKMELFFKKMIELKKGITTGQSSW